MWLRGAQYLAHLALNTHTFVVRCDCSSDDHRVWNNSRYVNQEPGNGSCEGQVVCGCSVGLVVSLLKLSLWYKMTLGSHQLVVMARGPCKTSVVLWNLPVKQKLALWRMSGIICIFCAFIYICDVTSRSKKNLYVMVVIVFQWCPLYLGGGTQLKVCISLSLSNNVHASAPTHLHSHWTVQNAARTTRIRRCSTVIRLLHLQSPALPWDVRHCAGYSGRNSRRLHRKHYFSSEWNSSKLKIK